MKYIAYAFYAAGILALAHAFYYTIALDRLMGEEFIPAVALFIGALATQLVLPKPANG